MRRASPVLWASLAVVLPFVAWGVLAPTSLGEASAAARVAVVDRFGWFYLLVATAALVGVVAIAVSRLGRVRLGRDGDQPEYSTGTWFAMLFSAGMGIGLVFWGVAEPVAHLTAPAVLEPGTDAAAREALRASFFHWGLHPWAIYSALALALALARFRHGERGLVSTALRPVLGDRVDGPLGTVVDTVAVVATVLGVATSLGLGAAQVAGGFGALTDAVPATTAVQLAVIAVVTALFLASALAGISRGIARLSNVNMVLAGALLLFVLVAGPTNALIGSFTSTLGTYLTELPSASLQTAPFDETRAAWINGWTIFYWAWWMSWSPFVATFIARVSKGRTVREFVVGVLAVPTLLGGLWFAVFGGAGILAQQGGTDLAGAATEAQLFALLDTLPGGYVASVGAVILIVTFFITSADSATYVLGSLTHRGADPTRPLILTWGLLISLSAAVLLLAGGLQALQTASIVAALPFAVVLLLALVAVIRSLKDDPAARKGTPAEPLAASASTPAPPTDRGDDVVVVPDGDPVGDGRRDLAGQQ